MRHLFYSAYSIPDIQLIHLIISIYNPLHQSTLPLNTCKMSIWCVSCSGLGSRVVGLRALGF